MSFKFLIKVALIRNVTLLLKALGKECPPMFHKMGPIWKQMPISRALLSISFGVPSKGTLPPGLPHRAPTEKDAVFPEPSSIHLSESPVSEHPQGSPAGPQWREMPISRAFLYVTFMVPSKGSPPSRFPSQSSHRERERETLYFHSPPSISQSPW